ncbi:hypothetical protein ANTRET_LOCUS10551 [Anthophora retusa]
MNLFILILSIQFCYLHRVSSCESRNNSLERSKRELDAKYLVFPEGSNVQLVYCMTISTYAKPSGLFTIGLTAGQAWQLPSRSMLSDKFGDYHRRSRRQLYRKVELLLGSQGKDGRSCVLKAICKAAMRSQTEIGKRSFMEEIIHAVFTLPETSDDTDPMTEYERAYFLKENCNEAELRCPDVF